MKMFLKQLVPPLLLSAIKKAIAPSKRIYKTYGEAVAACQNGAYENRELVKVVVDKNLAYKEKIQTDAVFDLGTLRTLIALGLSKSNHELNVIDFGGGGGYHHTIAMKAFGEDVKIKWNVVETTAMANEAQRISSSSLKFFDTIAEAVKNLDTVDCVFTSGALQYCPNPISFLKQLVDINAKFIYVTRTPFSDVCDDIISVQTSKLSANGPGPLPIQYSDRDIKYPITYVSRQAVENILSDKYEIRFMTQEGEGVFKMPNATISMDGYFCVRKNENN